MYQPNPKLLGRKLARNERLPGRIRKMIIINLHHPDAIDDEPWGVGGACQCILYNFVLHCFCINIFLVIRLSSILCSSRVPYTLWIRDGSGVFEDKLVSLLGIYGKVQKERGNIVSLPPCSNKEKIGKAASWIRRKRRRGEIGYSIICFV